MLNINKTIYHILGDKQSKDIRRPQDLARTERREWYYNPWGGGFKNDEEYED